MHIGFESNRFHFDTGTTLPITGAVLNYADPGFELASGPGTLEGGGTHWTLDFGSLAQGSDPGAALLAIRNTATAPADDLGGSFDLSGDGFAVAGRIPSPGLAAGDALLALHLRTRHHDTRPACGDDHAAPDQRQCLRLPGRPAVGDADRDRLVVARRTAASRMGSIRRSTTAGG